MDHSAHAGHDMPDGHAGHDMPAGCAAAHDKHAGHSVAMFRDKFWLSLLLTLPVLFWSHDLQESLGYEAPMFPGSEYLAAILGTVVLLYGGLVFVRGAAGELRDQQPGMMALAMSLSTIIVAANAQLLRRVRARPEDRPSSPLPQPA